MMPLENFLARFPLLQRFAIRHAQRKTEKQSDERWTYVQSVLSTIGNITISWASIELMLSHLVVWHHRKQNLHPEAGIPRMLAFQLQHIKKIAKDGSVDDATAAKLSDIRKRITELNDFRISVIHGVLHQRDESSTVWHTHSVKIDGMDARVAEKTYSNEEIQTRSIEISELAHEMSPFIAGIVGIPHPGNSK